MGAQYPAGAGQALLDHIPHDGRRLIKTYDRPDTPDAIRSRWKLSDSVRTGWIQRRDLEADWTQQEKRSPGNDKPSKTAALRQEWRYSRCCRDPPGLAGKADV